MTVEQIEISGRTCHVVRTSDSPLAVIIKPLGYFEREKLLDECSLTLDMACVPFATLAFEVQESDLLHKGAESTCRYVQDCLLPFVKENFGPARLIIGGYSLGGLFALYAATVLDNFDAVFAGSPSLWVDGWDEYADSHPLHTKYIYMSLGDREECTRKEPFCKVGDRVRRQHARNSAQLGAENSVLVSNEGGHFKDVEMRKATGFAWCIRTLSPTPLM